MNSFNKILVKLLALSKEEQKVIKYISPKVESTASLVTRTGLPRSTLIRSLNKLHTRGLISKHRISLRRGGWVKADEEKINSIISMLHEGKLQPVKIAKNNNEVVIYHGKEQMVILADKVLTFHKGERVYWMQPNKLWEVWLKHDLKDRVLWLTHYLKEKEIITEGFFADNFIEYDFKHGGKKLLKGYLDRPTIIHTIPEVFLQFYSDIMVFRDVVSIMNWKDEIAIEIKNQDLVDVFKSFFDYMKKNGKRVNLQEEAKRKLNSCK